MSNEHFSFKQFCVRQERCAMKVGTDGVLLGAWAQGGTHILDIGTGTGVVSLMMAQRFPDAVVTAIDIDAEAVKQAAENFAASPFAARLCAVHSPLQEFPAHASFDAIVSNPPYFDCSLPCPDHQRSMARHTSSLSFAELIGISARMLTDNGVLSIVIPTDYVSRIETEAVLNGLFLAQRLDIKTVERKPPKRSLLAFTKNRPAELVCETQVLMENGTRSRWYTSLTEDFYLT